MKSISTKQTYLLQDVDIIWEQYCRSMEKRRPGTYLKSDKFKSYLEDTYVYYYKYRNSYVIGQYQGKLFIPTHFAPAGLREGIESIKKMKEYDNVAFVVTPDLSDMLKKLNYKVLPISVMREFRGVEVEKSIVVSNIFYSSVLQIQNIFQKMVIKIKNLFKPKLKLKKKNRKNLFTQYSRELKQEEIEDIEELDEIEEDYVLMVNEDE